ncbi:hypothetical protein EVAR_18335_1 [Eumeta japonica]|uniref:Uncharacterized protein n=1 Tax=Eumeta variegata TaxID=151549 RepID=A0A4C1V9J0_EUMVA|nr:hypothetical protein EVAR_18335_1 [Eumeta japonica]
MTMPAASDDVQRRCSQRGTASSVLRLLIYASPSNGLEAPRPESCDGDSGQSSLRRGRSIDVVGEHVCAGYLGRTGLCPSHICIRTGPPNTILIKGFISEDQRDRTKLRSLLVHCYFCRRLIYGAGPLFGHRALRRSVFVWPRRVHCPLPLRPVALFVAVSPRSPADLRIVRSLSSDAAPATLARPVRFCAFVLFERDTYTKGRSHAAVSRFAISS